VQAFRFVVATLGLAVATAASGADAAETSTATGNVSFRTSCSDDVREDFDRGVALLHSFEYPESEKAFRAILEEAPECSMARWGIAMSLWHPLWAPPGEAALAAGASVLENAVAGAPTPREAAYLEAITAFYAGHGERSHSERAEAYRGRMEQVYRENLDDPEAAVFFALSLLATASPKDKSHAKQFEAAGLLNWVRNEHPHHPGVLHYLIHSYDYPGLAHLALPAAKIYADVAPASAHAQHMPSHIFTRLGLWERSIASNHDSTASAAHYTERAQLPGLYDEGLHSMDYLLYALLQTARDDEARAHLERLSQIGRANVDNFKVAYTYAAAPARYTLERRDWQGASRIDLAPEDFPWDEFPWARSILHFARGIGAARSGDLALARAELDRLVEIRDSLDPATLPYWREEVSVHTDAVASWIELRQGKIERALTLARAAAEREDSVDKHPVTPGEVVPARELLGDMLLEVGRASEAGDEYAAVLESSPNRWNALLGAARAARHRGDAAGARSTYRRILELSGHASGDRAALREVREALQ
jgi:tetratricopeptide (TPR) repeat protein